MGAHHMLTVVILDDQEVTVQLLSKFVLNIKKLGQIEVVKFTDERKAISWLLNNKADLILLDYKLNTMTGLDVISVIRLYPRHQTVPIVMVTEFDQRELLYKALDAGATDFLAKPIDPHECRARCTNLLSLRQHQIGLEQNNELLRQQVDKSLKDTLFRLARAGEFRDSDTGNHILRIARYSRLIAEGLGLPKEICENIELASPMHDVGKIGIPDHILLKNGPLSETEWNIMRRHTTIGHEILSGSDSKYMQLGATIALNHHEKYDGTGYPNRLKGNEIPIEARIVAVADVFDALTAVRPYKESWSIEAAAQFLIDSANRHFDPECVDVFSNEIETVRSIFQSLQEDTQAKVINLSNPPSQQPA